MPLIAASAVPPYLIVTTGVSSNFGALGEKFYEEYGHKFWRPSEKKIMQSGSYAVLNVQYSVYSFKKSLWLIIIRCNQACLERRAGGCRGKLATTLSIKANYACSG
jgi:hypothetical protein